MSITNNGKQKRNKKKKRLIKLLIIVIILFILLMLADTLLLQHRKNVDREQRKAEAIAALERVPTVTPTPAATPTPTPTPIPTVTQHLYWKGHMFLTRRTIWEPGAVRMAGLRSKLRNSVRSRLHSLIGRQIRKRQLPVRQK